MEVKCEYCGSLIPDDAAVCPNCGATNVNMNRAADDTPKTIEELKKWYQDRGLPPYEQTRFFIGIDCKEPKAFGIYEENGTFIVYKNKADGSRAIRYKGTDEDYAVNELYLKLKSEILNQREKQAARPRQSRQQKTKSSNKNNGSPGILLKAIGVIAGIMLAGMMFLVAVELNAGIVIGVFVGLLLLSFVFRKIFKKHQGKVILIFACIFIAITILVIISNISGFTPRYYYYNNTAYVWYDDSYYYYDSDIDDYTILDNDDVPPELYSSPDSYHTTVSDHDYNYGNSDSDYTYIPDFTSSDEYTSWIDTIDFDSSFDSDYDWDSGFDWDTGGTDWDSDW